MLPPEDVGDELWGCKYCALSVHIHLNISLRKNEKGMEGTSMGEKERCPNRRTLFLPVPVLETILKGCNVSYYWVMNSCFCKG